MTSRRTFVGASIAVVAGAMSSRTAGSTAMPRIGLLLPARTGNDQAFIEELRALGYVDGRTATIERRSADGDFARLPALAADLVASKPDVIAAFVTQASIAAKQATSTIPIVMVAVGDPVGSRLVADLARPGGNVTGTGGRSSADVGKQVELARELRPGARRITVLWNPGNPVFQQQSLREAVSAARRLGLRLDAVEARSADDVDDAIARIASDRPDAVVVLGDPLFVATVDRIAASLAKHRLPAIGGTRAYAEAGMLASYAPDLTESARRAAVYVDRILKGAKPGDLPVELVGKFELVLNRRAAKALGIVFPPSLLARADEVLG